jgi:hypothetical protein
MHTSTVPSVVSDVLGIHELYLQLHDVLGIQSVFFYLDLPFEAYVQFRYMKCNSSDCVSRLAFVSGVRVSYQAIPCGICGRQSYVLTEFSARNSAFPLFFRPTNVPYFIFIYLPSMLHIVSN